MLTLELVNSLELGLIYGIIAIGIYLTFRVIDFPDLTCDGSFVLGSATSAVMLKLGVNPPLALIFAFLAGSLAGLLTGILNRVFKVSNLLSGILTAFMLYSINLRVMGGTPNITLISEETIFTYNSPLIILTLLSILVCIIVTYLLITDFGLALRSIGKNSHLALNSGVRVSFVTIIGLMLSNGLIGFGGALFSQKEGFADISQGFGTVIVGLAAVIIGERLLPSRTQWILIVSCIVGSIAYRILVSIALHSEWLGLETQDLNLITGIMVVAIMQKARSKKC